MLFPSELTHFSSVHTGSNCNEDCNENALISLEPKFPHFSRIDLLAQKCSLAKQIVNCYLA